MEKFFVIFQLHIALRLRRIYKTYKKMFVYAFKMCAVVTCKVPRSHSTAQHSTLHTMEMSFEPSVSCVCLFIENILYESCTNVATVTYFPETEKGLNREISG